VFRTRMCGQTLLFIVIANCAIGCVTNDYTGKQQDTNPGLLGETTSYQGHETNEQYSPMRRLSYTRRLRAPKPSQKSALSAPSCISFTTTWFVEDIPNSAGQLETQTNHYAADYVANSWRFGVAVTRWSRSTQLLYIEPG